jgi:hypothetical protein
MNRKMAAPSSARPAITDADMIPIFTPVDKPPLFASCDRSEPVFVGSTPLLVVVAPVGLEEDGLVVDGVEDCVAVVVLVRVEMVAVFEMPAATRKLFSVTARGVAESLQAVDMVLYTVTTSAWSEVPRQAAEFVTKFPPLLHRHWFNASTVSPWHPDEFDAWYRQACELVG